MARGWLTGDALPAEEGLGVPCGGSAFHSAQAHQRKECFFGEPVLICLSPKESAQMLCLPSANLLVQTDKEIGVSKITVVLGDLVLQDQVTSESIPREVRQKPVILVAVIPIVGEDQIRLKGSLDLLEIFLDVLALERKETALESLDDNSLPSGPAQEGSRARAGFPRTAALRAEHHPPNVELAVISDQLEQRSATTNLDVVRVRTQAKDVLDVIETELDHITQAAAAGVRVDTPTVGQTFSEINMRAASLSESHLDRRPGTRLRHCMDSARRPTNNLCRWAVIGQQSAPMGPILAMDR